MSALRDRLAAFAARAPWLVAFAGAILVFAATLAFTGGAGGPDILSTALSFATLSVIVGLGQMFVVTTGPGNVDLSIPSTIALAGTVAMTVMAGDDRLVALGLAAAVGIGVLVGTFNYALIRLLQIPPIIATLSASFLIQSAAIAYGRGLRVRPPEGFAAFATGRVAGVPNLAIATLVLSVALAVLLHRTLYGRSVSAIGQNARAAALAGVRVGRVRLLTYILSAALAGLCGAVLAGFSGGASLNMGEEYLLASIAVVVVGGSSVSGGQSNVTGIWGASLFLYLLTTLLNTVGIGAGVRYVLTGLIIIAVIVVAGGPRRARG